MLMLLLACADLPSEPPVPPSRPNRFDTAIDDGPPDFLLGQEGGGRAPTIVSANISNKLTSTREARLKVAVKDPDGDRTSTRVDWYVNDIHIPGVSTTTLSPSHFNKGDRVHAVVEVSDGQNRRERKVDPVLVQNSPPKFITKKGDFRTVDGFQLEAADPDGDLLTWRIEDAPPGMGIDQTGRLRYSGQENAGGGAWSVKIIVEDPDGESIVWPLELNVNAGSDGG